MQIGQVLATIFKVLMHFSEVEFEINCICNEVLGYVILATLMDNNPGKWKASG